MKSLASSVLVLLAACGAVAVPPERSYRLPAPDAVAPAAVRDGRVLRVDDLKLAAHLSADHLMVADGPVLLRPYPLERWAGPLDGMVSELVVGCLRRAAAFAEVKTNADSGSEDLQLSGTLLDFHHDRGAGQVRVRMLLRLHRVRDGLLILAQELSASRPVAGDEPAAVVAALAQAAIALAGDLARVCGEAAAAPGR